MLSQHRWQQLMNTWAWEAHQTTFVALCQAHAEPHRHYHTAAHIEATLRHLDAVVDLADRPHEIELALWFHDAIYRPYSSHNEADSAQWADQFMSQNQAADAAKGRVHDLIMATCHQAPTTTNDQAIMVDVDLSILGASHDLYAQYETWIRQEYRWVPNFLYRRKRKALLNGFLQQSRIFQTDHFEQRLELQARQNLNWAVAQL
ncbi:HD domain-containing protein [Marinicella meishanensis]|uniref:HD domain-containing protein n=1 Tax=Marinicella meishanensis TaxID=2873263 RepID=UPI001CBABDAB|nr:hypothetical protein [Marinicella sp. NBU2979]